MLDIRQEPKKVKQNTKTQRPRWSDEAPVSCPLQTLMGWWSYLFWRCCWLPSLLEALHWVESTQLLAACFLLAEVSASQPLPYGASKPCISMLSQWEDSCCIICITRFPMISLVHVLFDTATKLKPSSRFRPGARRPRHSKCNRVTILSIERRFYSPKYEHCNKQENRNLLISVLPKLITNGNGKPSWAGAAWEERGAQRGGWTQRTGEPEEKSR